MNYKKRQSLQEQPPQPVQTKRSQKALAHKDWFREQLQFQKAKLPEKQQFLKNWTQQTSKSDQNQEQEEEKSQQQQILNKNEISKIDGDTIVCVRQRPLLNNELNTNYAFPVNIVNNPKVSFFDIQQTLTGVPSFKQISYKVDYAFDEEDSNEEIYEKVGQNVVQLGLNHGIGSFLAYGQTGSGKTYTITGMLQGIGRDIFALQEQSQNKKKIFITYIEMGASGDVDLLNNRQPIIIKCYPGLEECIKGNTEFEITSEQEFHKRIDNAQKLRSQQPTYKNNCSSRSIAYLKFRIVDEDLKEKQGKKYKDGEISVVDMPGSEYAPDRQFHNDHEAMNSVMINFSIIELKRTLLKKAEARMYPNRKVHVNQSPMPFLRLIRDLIEPFPKRETQIVFFSNISPSILDMAQTKNTLDYTGPLKIGGGGTSNNQTGSSKKKSIVTNKK